MHAHLLDGGPVRRRDLLGVSATPRALAELLRQGEVVEVLRDVYLAGALVDDLAARTAAVGLVLPAGAVAARGTAAWLHGVDTRGPGERTGPPPLECAVPAGRAPARRDGVRCWAEPLDGRDVVELRGVPVTSGLRTAVDLARWRPHWLGLSACDALARAGGFVPVEACAEVERWRGDRWVDRARSVLRLVDTRSESPGESWTRLRLVEAGFVEPEPQVVVADGDRHVVARLDLADVERRSGWEYDGVAFHSSPEQRAHDARRRRDVERLGWQVWAFGMEAVLGRSMALERCAGAVYGREPLLRRRRW